MLTQTSSVAKVLSQNATSFFIPPYQRAYAWGRPEIERFFTDISRIVDSELNPKQTDKIEHFFGTLVLRNEDLGFSSRSIIVDGQQRLTSTLLFVIALRDLEKDEEKRRQITNMYLKNPQSSYDSHIKLKQVTQDWDAYKALVVGGELVNDSKVTRAYQLFVRLITDKKRLTPEVRTEHFLIALNRLNVAAIFLDERPHKGEDPQVIFETLNSLGKPLTLADLVRNFVLLSIGSEEQTELYEEHWHPKIEGVLEEDTSDFLRDFLQHKTNAWQKSVTDGNTKELYYSFKEYFEGNFDNRREFVKDVIKYVRPYLWIIRVEHEDKITYSAEENKEIRELLRNIFHDIKGDAFKPLVLGLLYYHQYGEEGVKLSDSQLIESLLAIRTYLIRRRLLGISQGENRNIVLLCNRIPEIASGSVTMLRMLAELQKRLRLPRDYEVEQQLRAMDFYNYRKYPKFVLGKIEEHCSKVAVDFRSSKISIEHLMPRRLTDEWRKELGENYEEVHHKYLHNIGNLILTEFNGEMGNKPFSAKKERLKESNLGYRLDVLSNEKWDEESILEHQEVMIERFLKTFPLPEEYNRMELRPVELLEVTDVSPLDDGAVDVVRGRLPKSLTILGESFEVRSWQAVLLAFLKYVKEHSPNDLQYFVQVQEELFWRNDMFIKWSRLRERFEEEKIAFRKRYKTLEGQLWNRVEPLLDETLFVHVNISSTTCVRRLATMMEKLYLGEDDVVVKLKEKK